MSKPQNFSPWKCGPQISITLLRYQRYTATQEVKKDFHTCAPNFHFIETASKTILLRSMICITEHILALMMYIPAALFKTHFSCEIAMREYQAHLLHINKCHMFLVCEVAVFVNFS